MHGGENKYTVTGRTERVLFSQRVVKLGSKIPENIRTEAKNCTYAEVGSVDTELHLSSHHRHLLLFFFLLLLLIKANTRFTVPRKV